MPRSKEDDAAVLGEAVYGTVLDAECPAGIIDDAVISAVSAYRQPSQQDRIRRACIDVYAVSGQNRKAGKHARRGDDRY